MSSEFELIEGFSDRFGVPPGVRVGIGDDAAVLQRDRFDTVAMDTMVEDVHFRRRWSSGADVGWKLTAANLSDIAAMGAKPGPFFLSLALPTPVDEPWLDAFCAGIQEAVQTLVPHPDEVSAAGGDLTSISGPAVVTMTIMGDCAPAEPLLRSGASPGDAIVVSRLPGRSAAGLAVLEQGADTDRFDSLVDAHLRPAPPIALGRRIGLEAGASAMIDISDGLIQDLGHILCASDVGADVDISGLTAPNQMLDAADAGLGSVSDWILGGGEDYGLIMTVPIQQLEAFRELFADHRTPVRIGTVRPADDGLTVIDVEGRQVDDRFDAGFQHFEES